MDHVRLGRTGLQVSRLCLGTMTFGLQSDEQTSFAILDRAAEAGITFIDTADVYPMGGTLEYAGRTEVIVGRWLKGRRDEFVVATKGCSRTGPRPWQEGSSRKQLTETLEDSLRRLGTDYVDLYQLHHPDPGTPIEETLSVLDDFVRAGKVRYVGCSNFQAYQVARALGHSETLRVAKFVSVQPRYNLLFRELERELLPLCAEEGLAVLPYNPLAGGMLSGKHQDGEPTADTRFTVSTVRDMYRDRYWHRDVFATVNELRAVADELGLPLVTTALSWVMANPVVTAPIIGASRPEQLDDNLRALDVELDTDTKKRLDEITYRYRLGDATR
ncbi:aldo/keto reductase [Kribbella flavida DSM 17836]|uniref:Aldo/keto reductase n=1 Tax=Kribbella flavida (strain DSM 17836 / JCM 10339 / NBRC 14399) TaxID=479435 RepID=D2PUN8_KRIFD|nr:aldo/keto reductase [Kribbella flavida]ADB29556.1 aldo/keto reductase [Kribbella flavida DSM 17836]